MPFVCFAYVRLELCLAFADRLGGFLIGIFEVGLCGAREHLCQIFISFPSGFGQIHQEVVSAVLWRLSWHVALEVGNEGEGLSHERQDVG